MSAKANGSPSTCGPCRSRPVVHGLLLLSGLERAGHRAHRWARDGKKMLQPHQRRLFALCIVLAAVTVGLQVHRLGWAYVDHGRQVRKLTAVLEGRAGDPWQYRILTAHAVHVLVGALGALRIPHPFGVAFVGFRLAENVAIFLLAAQLYAALGLTRIRVAGGLALLAWSMTQSFYDSDLALSTYMDVIVYLVGTRLILERRLAAFPLLVALGALNRETAILLPTALLLAAANGHFVGRDRTVAWGLGATSLAVGVATLGLVRLAYPPRHTLLPYGHRPGLPLLAFNLGHWRTWFHLLRVVHVLPWYAWRSRSRWPLAMRAWAIAIVPTWCVAHLVFAVAAEVRLFLVPIAIVAIPGALLYTERRERFAGLDVTRLGGAASARELHTGTHHA